MIKCVEVQFDVSKTDVNMCGLCGTSSNNLFVQNNLKSRYLKADSTSTKQRGLRKTCGLQAHTGVRASSQKRGTK